MRVNAVCPPLIVVSAFLLLSIACRGKGTPANPPSPEKTRTAIDHPSSRSQSRDAAKHQAESAPKTEAQLNEAFGLALVTLANGNTSRGRTMLSRVHSRNALAILERMQKASGPWKHNFDPEDPTLWAFKQYLRHLADTKEFAYLRDLLRDVERQNPNGDLGVLYTFENAVFSPGSKYLTVWAIGRVFVLETETGKTVENVEIDFEKVNGASIFFSPEDHLVLRVVISEGVSNGRFIPDDALLSMEERLTRRNLWKKRITQFANVEAAFTRDYEKIVFRAQADEGVEYHILDAKSGKEISVLRIPNPDWEDEQVRFRNMIAAQAQANNPLDDHFTARSPDGRYIFKGHRSAGSFKIIRVGEQHPIRALRFGSDIE